MDTFNSQTAFADTSRDEDEVGSPLVMRSQTPSEVEDDRTEGDEKETFLKLAHAM